MPMFLVTFMALLFWIATWLTIQIVCEPFRPWNTGLRFVRQADILSAFRLHESGVQLRRAHRPGGLCSTSSLADNLSLSAVRLGGTEVSDESRRTAVLLIHMFV